MERGDNFDVNLQAAMAAVGEFGGDGIQDWLEQTGAGNDPTFIRMFANISRAMAEDGSCRLVEFPVPLRQRGYSKRLTISLCTLLWTMNRTPSTR